MLLPLKRAKKCGEAAGVHNPLEETGSRGQNPGSPAAQELMAYFFKNYLHI